jgi:tRNA pseudouridine38-40 synthase
LLIGQVVAVGERSLSLDAFASRWRRRARHEVREAAPPQGLCLLRVGYPEAVFAPEVWYDSQPRYSLGLPEQIDSQITV